MLDNNNLKILVYSRCDKASDAIDTIACTIVTSFIKYESEKQVRSRFTIEKMHTVPINVVTALRLQDSGDHSTFPFVIARPDDLHPVANLEPWSCGRNAASVR